MRANTTVVRVVTPVVFLFLGCDPDKLINEITDGAQKAAEAEAAKADQNRDVEPDPAPACVAACEADATLSPTNRETCRLNCKELGQGEPVKPEQAAVQRYGACVDTCSEGKMATDAETCKLNCVRSAAQALPEQGDEAKKCTTICFGAMARCRDECSEAPASEDNRATCRLHCDDSARRCIEGC